jgi:hypothetical protein
VPDEDVAVPDRQELAWRRIGTAVRRRLVLKSAERDDELLGRPRRSGR